MAHRLAPASCLRRPSAAHPCAACAIPPDCRVFRRVEAWFRSWLVPLPACHRFDLACFVERACPAAWELPDRAPDSQGTAAPRRSQRLASSPEGTMAPFEVSALPQARKAQRSPPKPAPLLQAQQTRRPRPEPKVIALDQIHGCCFPRLGENLSSVTVLRGACAAGQGPAPRAARWPQAPLSPPARTKAGRRSFTRCPAAGQPCMSTPRK